MTRLYDQGRYTAFEEKYNWIERRLRDLNQSSYEVAINQFADWTESEISAMFSVFNYTKSGSTPSTFGDLHESWGWWQQNDLEESSSSTTQASTTVIGRNWATDNNPVGMSVVPTPRNQGLCGGKSLK